MYRTKRTTIAVGCVVGILLLLVIAQVAWMLHLGRSLSSVTDAGEDVIWEKEPLKTTRSGKMDGNVEVSRQTESKMPILPPDKTEVNHSDEDTFILNWHFWEQMMRSRTMFAKFRWTMKLVDPKRHVVEHTFGSATHLGAQRGPSQVPLGELVNMTRLNEYAPVVPLETWSARTGGKLDAIFVIVFSKEKLPHSHHHTKVVQAGGKIRLATGSSSNSTLRINDIQLFQSMLESYPATSHDQLHVYLVDSATFDSKRKGWEDKVRTLFEGYRTVLLDSFSQRLEIANGAPPPDIADDYHEVHKASPQNNMSSAETWRASHLRCAAIFSLFGGSL